MILVLVAGERSIRTVVESSIKKGKNLIFLKDKLVRVL